MSKEEFLKEFLKEHQGLKGKTHRIETFEIGKISCQRLVNGIIEDMGEYPEDALPNIPDLITKPKEPNEFRGKTLGYIKDNVVDIQDIHETQIDKAKVKEFIKLEQELVKSLATKEQIENNPLNQKVRDKIKEMGLR